MKKINLVFLINLLILNTLFAVKDNEVVAVVSFTDPTFEVVYHFNNLFQKDEIVKDEVNPYERYTTMLTEVMVDAFVNSNRFTVVDRTHLDKVMAEADLQRGDRFNDQNAVKLGKLLGANYIVTGYLGSIAVSESRDSKGRLQGYLARIDYTMKMVDVETGEIKSTERIDTKDKDEFFFGLLSTSYPTPEEAISQSISSSVYWVRNGINRIFPITGPLFEVSAQKKGKAQEIVIAVGGKYGVKEKDVFEIIEKKAVTLNGEEITRSIKVGTVRVSRVDDENFSTCTVKKGHESILSKFDNGTPLEAVIKIDENDDN